MSNHPVQETAESRRGSRQPIESPVRMRLETGVVDGLGDNISSVGLFFFTDQPLRVQVDVDDGDEVRSYAGRLVRVQRMNETSTGIAIEFDE